jgi:hypothetical protein
MNSRTFLTIGTALLLAACGGNNVQSGPVAPGFYRYSDEAAVFSIPPSGNTYCVVVNPSMMYALGGFPQVHVVDHTVDFKGNRTWTAQCPWPAGKFRNAGTTVVYVVHPYHTVCRETPAVAAKFDPSVHVIASDSNVLLKSKYTGTCAKT